MPPVSSPSDGRGRDRDPRQASGRGGVGVGEPLHRPPSVHDALNLMTDSSPVLTLPQSRSLAGRLRRQGSR